MRIIQLGLVFAIITAAIVSAVAASAQQATHANAPAAAELYTAKKVFVSNAGAGSGLFTKPFSGDPNRAYNEF